MFCYCIVLYIVLFGYILYFEIHISIIFYEYDLFSFTNSVNVFNKLFCYGVRSCKRFLTVETARSRYGNVKLVEL